MVIIMNLDELRQQIDCVDKEIAVLFEKRMEIAKNIGEYKKEHNSAIFVPEREDQLISDRCGSFSDGVKPFAIRFFKQLMSISRDYQSFTTLDKNIVMIGVMGCGKSVTGRQIASRLNIDFVDIDTEIEQQTNMKISEFFSEYGEEKFRQTESEMIEKTAQKAPQVISTGGGVVLSEHNMQILKNNGIILFFNRDINAIAASIDTSNRPLLKEGTHKLYEIYNERLPLYRKWADIEVTCKNIDSIIENLQKFCPAR